MKLIDLDQTIFVPIVDESKGGVTYEMQMTVEQFFRRFINEVPPTIDAIPVEWMKQWRDRLKGMGEYQRERAEDISFVLGLWQREQEEK